MKKEMLNPQYCRREQTAKSEILNPKTEGSPKSEIRTGNRSRSEPAPRQTLLSAFGFRISFGFRPSDFGFPFSPPSSLAAATPRIPQLNFPSSSLAIPMAGSNLAAVL
jgi:hypothetical protein